MDEYRREVQAKWNALHDFVEQLGPRLLTEAERNELCWRHAELFNMLDCLWELDKIEALHAGLIGE